MSSFDEENLFQTPEKMETCPEVPTQVDMGDFLDNPYLEDDEETMKDQSHSEFIEEEDANKVDDDILEVFQAENIEIPEEAKVSPDAPDDLTVLAGIINTERKNSAARKKVMNQLRIVLRIKAVFMVYTTEKPEKDFDKLIKVVKQLELLFKTLPATTNDYVTEKFLVQLTGQDIPDELWQEHQAEKKEKAGKTFKESYKSLMGVRSEEEFNQANYGQRCLNVAAAARNFIQSSISPRYRPINSGESEAGLLRAIRMILFHEHKETEAEDHAKNKVKNQSKVLKIKSEGEESKDEEMLTISKAPKIGFTAEGKKKKQEEILAVKEKRLKELEEEKKEFDPTWYPKEWLAFLLLSLPAKDRALSQLVPFSYKPANTTVVPQPPRKKKFEESESSSSSSNTKKAVRTQSPQQKTPLKHYHVHLTRDQEKELFEKEAGVKNKPDELNFINLKISNAEKLVEASKQYSSKEEQEMYHRKYIDLLNQREKILDKLHEANEL